MAYEDGPNGYEFDFLITESGLAADPVKYRAQYVAQLQVHKREKKFLAEFMPVKGDTAYFDTMEEETFYNLPHFKWKRPQEVEEIGRGEVK